MDGVLVLDKPAGISSAGLLNRIKRMLPKKTKIGHAGTLDPFATGVLLALIGKSTKRSLELMAQNKVYVATVKLGATTTTLDPTKEETPVSPTSGREPTENDIRDALSRYTGPILQIPPAFSAISVGGHRSYNLARKGVEVELQPRTVQVYSMTLRSFAYPFVELEMEVGKGFYVRSLARDLGQALGSAGYLTALRRTQVGPYRADEGVTFHELSREMLFAKLGVPLPIEVDADRLVSGDSHVP